MADATTNEATRTDAKKGGFVFTMQVCPCDKVLFPGAQLFPEAERPDTTFFNDFVIAEKFGKAAVKDTFKRAFSEWKSDIKYLTELSVVMNHLGWMHYSKKHEEASIYYFGCYNKINDFVYQSDDEGNNTGPFTDAEVVYYHNVLD